MLSDNLPDALMMEIIIRLPVKSLLRFKCVVKSWYALITNHSFIINQLEWSNYITKNRRPKLILRQDVHPHPPVSISLISNIEESYEIHDLELPFPENNLELLLAYGQCNGIFCLHGVYKGDGRSTFDDEQSRLILWNLATKEVKVISEFQWQLHLIGFGFDPITMDYKIVRLPYHWFLENDEEQPLVEVYNLSTNSWRAINVDVPIPNFVAYYRHWGSYLNGAYHWLNRNDYEIGKRILSFDFSKENFGIISEPLMVNQSPCINNLLAIVDESLAYVATYEYYVEIWVMNEYGVESSWTKKFKIGQIPDFQSIVGFWGDTEIILVQENDGRLISYNHRNQQRQRFQIHFVLAVTMDYVESLLPLGG